MVAEGSMLASKKDHIVYLSNSLRASWWGIIWCGTGRLSRNNSSSSLPTISTAKYTSKNWRSVCWPFAAQSQCLLLASLIHCSGTSVDKPYYTDRNYSHGIKNPSKYPSYIWTDPTKCEDIFLPPGYWRIYATNMFCHLFCQGMWC